MVPPIHEQVVVVTGSSSGVGRAIAKKFGAEGAKVALLSRNKDALDDAATEIERAGGQALVLPLDVADYEAVEAAAAQVEQRWGRIDTWINVAMLTVFAPVWEMQADEFRRVTEVTYLGYVHGTMAALKRMRPRNQGTIVQVGSALAYRSIPLQSAYCAAKAAIRGFTDSLRTELIHDHKEGVRLTMMQLPAVNTPQATRQRNKMPRQSQPVPPMYAPEVIADMAVYAAIHAPREMIIGQSTLQAIWGELILRVLGQASWLDRYVATTWDKQMIQKPNDQNGHDILFHTLPGDPGAHGPYRDEEHGPDWQMQVRTHPIPVLAAAGAVAGSAVGLLAGGRRAA